MNPDSLEALWSFLCSEDNLMGMLAVPFVINVWPDNRDGSVYIATIDPANLLLIEPEKYTQRTAEGDGMYIAPEERVAVW